MTTEVRWALNLALMPRTWPSPPTTALLLLLRLTSPLLPYYEHYYERLLPYLEEYTLEVDGEGVQDSTPICPLRWQRRRRAEGTMYRIPKKESGSCSAMLGKHSPDLAENFC